MVARPWDARGLDQPLLAVAVMLAAVVVAVTQVDDLIARGAFSLPVSAA